MSETDTGNDKVVVNRCMSLDGFIAGPGHVMDWGGGRQLSDFVGPDEFHEIAAATGAMLVGRRTADVGARMEAEKPGSVDYPFSGPIFVLTHRPPEPPDPNITYLTGDIEEAVATARRAAGGGRLEVLGADVAALHLRVVGSEEGRCDQQEDVELEVPGVRPVQEIAPDDLVGDRDAGHKDQHAAQAQHRDQRRRLG